MIFEAKTRFRDNKTIEDSLLAAKIEAEIRELLRKYGHIAIELASHKDIDQSTVTYVLTTR